MQNKELTYQDFKIGQVVTCVKYDNDDYWEQHLTIGKKYKINDLDYHFFNKICIKTDTKRFSQFIPIEFFTDDQSIRKMKLEKLNKICSK